MRRLLRSLWLRITIASTVVLVIMLGVVVFAVYELTLVLERTEVDDVLEREGRSLSEQIVTEITDIASSTPGRAIESAEIERVVSRALALHPGSSLHLGVVRVDDRVLSTARGPERLEGLRDVGMLPDIPVGTFGSVAGVRARSAEVVLANRTIVVETLGDDAAIAADARKMAVRTLLASIPAALIGLLGLAFVVHRSTRTLSSVSTTVRRTRLDDLTARVPEPTGSGEVALLARDVNGMLDDLSVARAARDELIASVSHELRTPLAAARGHTDLLREGRSSDERATIGRIDRELQRITRLVDDLLALSRAGDPSWLATRLVNVRDLFDDLSSRLPALGADHVHIAPAPDVVVEVDADRLQQALSNLVTNAIAHTPDGTDVSVIAEVAGTCLVIRVSDTGPGLPADVLERLGEVFVRGSVTGSGLGLAVTRAVAVAHGGRLSARSDDTGTEMCLTLPLDDQAVTPRT